LISSWMS